VRIHDRKVFSVSKMCVLVNQKMINSTSGEQKQQVRVIQKTYTLL
jgi:hypothetical protein